MQKWHAWYNHQRHRLLMAKFTDANGIVRSGFVAVVHVDGQEKIATSWDDEPAQPFEDRGTYLGTFDPDTARFVPADSVTLNWDRGITHPEQSGDTIAAIFYPSETMHSPLDARVIAV